MKFMWKQEIGAEEKQTETWQLNLNY